MREFRQILKLNIRTRDFIWLTVSAGEILAEETLAERREPCIGKSSS